SVSGFAVCHTVRSRSQVSSRMARNSGSRWPSKGRASPAVASGYGLHGPGPIRMRSETTMNANRRRAPRRSRYEQRADQAVENVRFGREAGGETEMAHQPGQHHRPTDDHIGAVVLHSRPAPARRGRFTSKGDEQALDRTPSQQV